MDNDKKSKILIVDDEAINIKVLSEALKNDYDIYFSTNGKHAIQCAKDKKPDLILLDIVMPDLDGYEICKALKENPETKDIIIIFISVLSEVDNETQGLELGAVDYITKPISSSVVKARVKTHLSLKNALTDLQKSNELLKETVNLREEIESIIRHDLKLPLSGIIGLPELIKINDNLTNEQIEYLDIIEESGYKMLNMINISQSLLKIERDIYKLQPVLVNFYEIIKKICFELRDIINQKELDIKILFNGEKSYKKDSIYAYGEELLCYSMLSNILKNAVEASPFNQEIIIDFHYNENNMLETRISNKGSVPAEIENNFFEKYVTFNKDDGTGLGTYSAKMFAKIQKGNIVLDSSQEDDKTTLTITIPSTKIKNKDKLIKLLIVDDSPTSRLFVRLICKDSDEIDIVGEAHDGFQAIKMSTQLHPDLIIMDVVMPELNGIEVTRRIMSTNPTKILILTAHMSSSEMDVAFEALKAGALDIMSKPNVLIKGNNKKWEDEFLNKIKSLYAI